MNKLFVADKGPDLNAFDITQKVSALLSIH